MVWGKPATGAWANAVEEEEQEHGTIQAPAAAPEKEFPSLGVAATVKETKKDKKKKQTMSLSDFMSSGAGSGRRVMNDPILDLPTAPRGRVEGEEEPSTLGGGFRAYGGDRYGGGAGGQRGGRFDSEERRPRRERDEEDMGPSRADATDNWGAERKFVPGDGDRGGYRDRGGFGGDRGGFGGGFRDREERPPREFDDGPSRADTGDWGAKQFVPSTDRSGLGAGGFRGERDSFREPREPTRADIEDKWERKGGDDAKPIGFDDRPRRTFDDAPPRERRSGFADNWRGRDRSVGSGPSSRDTSRDQWRKETPPSTIEEDAPRERPKLLLKPRTASADARAAAAAAGGEDGSRPSIFGAARPREEILKQQGRDAIEEDKRLEEAAKAAAAPRPRRERRERADTEEEAALKAKIEEVKAKQNDEEEASEEEKSKIAEEVAALEAELAKLKVEADEKAAEASRGRGGSRRERGGDRRQGGGGGGGAAANGGDDEERSGAASDARRDGGGFKKRDENAANRW